MHSIDIFVQNYFLLARTAPFTEFMILVTKLFDVSVHLALLSFFVTWLVYLIRDFRHAALFVSALVLGAISAEGLKVLFNIDRPLGAVMQVSGQDRKSTRLNSSH